MNVTMRRMKPEDVSAVAALDRISFSLPWPERSFQYEVTENPAARCWVAVNEQGRILAMVVSWIIVDELHIATLATLPEFRRQGIGAGILTEALRDGRELGARVAHLEVRAGNEAAQTMYRKFGFEVVGRRPRYYRDNDEDALLMSADLRPDGLRRSHES